MGSKLFLAAFAVSFAFATHAQADGCNIAAITDRIWDQPSCPSGVCRTLLLRSDGTYQISHITISPLAAYCESGQWQQEPGSCGTLRLKPCKDAERTAPWTTGGKTLTFGKSTYDLSDKQKESITAFVGCTVRRLCNGLSCGEYLACLQDCGNSIFPGPECPSRCLERVSPDVSHQVTSLLSCARTSGCTDDACIERVCSSETRACMAK